MIANVVVWSVIAMLKEYIFLALALSALAVLVALLLNEKCCKTRKKKNFESNQEEENQPEGQPLIESGGQEGKIELEVKLESATGEGSKKIGRKELAEVSKENEGVPEHKGAGKGQAGGKGLEVGKEPIEGQEEEKVELEPLTGERASQTDTSTEKEPS